MATRNVDRLKKERSCRKNSRHQETLLPRSFQLPFVTDLEIFALVWFPCTDENRLTRHLHCLNQVRYDRIHGPVIEVFISFCFHGYILNFALLLAFLVVAQVFMLTLLEFDSCLPVCTLL